MSRILLTLCLGLSVMILPAAGSESVSDFQLEIRDTSNNLIQAFPVNDNEWCLYWNHSVTGIAVQDCYRIEKKQLLLSHSWQPDFAAGLGHVEGRGILSEHPEGGYLISEINEPVTNNALWLRVGSRSVSHTLVSGNRELNLSEIAAGQRLLLLLNTTP
ncbi:DUF1850 domain-containing protein [Nitrincola schmidtii]|uniref:DUF1850 domain-containing protein n=1 Tax=Nitrincola schmidtii TaxID=1730894 RepID=UPI00124E7EF2|nr:DUF1850 domain-containing protein [Nitrincola schmidtii]